MNLEQNLSIFYFFNFCYKMLRDAAQSVAKTSAKNKKGQKKQKREETKKLKAEEKSTRSTEKVNDKKQRITIA